MHNCHLENGQQHDKGKRGREGVDTLVYGLEYI